MGRPREAHVNEEMRVCAVHGALAFRNHKIGTRNGVQRYRSRCPKCHTKSNRKGA